MTIQLVEASEDERGPFLLVADHIGTLLNDGQVIRDLILVDILIASRLRSPSVIWPPPAVRPPAHPTGREDSAH